MELTEITLHYSGLPEDRSKEIDDIHTIAKERGYYLRSEAEHLYDIANAYRVCNNCGRRPGETSAWQTIYGPGEDMDYPIGLAEICHDCEIAQRTINFAAK